MEEDNNKCDVDSGSESVFCKRIWTWGVRVLGRQSLSGSVHCMNWLFVSNASPELWGKSQDDILIAYYAIPTLTSTADGSNTQSWAEPYGHSTQTQRMHKGTLSVSGRLHALYATAQGLGSASGAKTLFVRSTPLVILHSTRPI